MTNHFGPLQMWQGHFIQSEWDQNAPATVWSAVMARNAAAFLERHSIDSARILDLGMGGGTFIGYLLCNTNASARVQNVVGVDIDAAAVQQAERAFFPVMFNGSCAIQRPKVHIAIGDAFELAASGGRSAPYLESLSSPDRMALAAQPFDVIALDIDPVYKGACGPRPRVTGMRDFFASLGTLVASGPHALVLNVDANECGVTRADKLRKVRSVVGDVLRDAGWVDVRDQVVAHPNEPSGPRASLFDINIVVIASGFQPWWRPAMLWSRLLNKWENNRSATRDSGIVYNIDSGIVYAMSAVFFCVCLTLTSTLMAAALRWLQPEDSLLRTFPLRAVAVADQDKSVYRSVPSSRGD